MRGWRFSSTSIIGLRASTYTGSRCVSTQSNVDRTRMRPTETMTISLPPAMAKQMALVQKEEHRTRSELLREAWRQSFEGRCALYKPAEAELASIRRGRADYKRGDVIPLSQLHDELESARQQKRPKRTRKTS